LDSKRSNSFGTDSDYNSEEDAGEADKGLNGVGNYGGFGGIASGYAFNATEPKFERKHGGDRSADASPDNRRLNGSRRPSWTNYGRTNIAGKASLGDRILKGIDKAGSNRDLSLFNPQNPRSMNP